jgi:hypothetical protein
MPLDMVVGEIVFFFPIIKFCPRIYAFYVPENFPFSFLLQSTTPNYLVTIFERASGSATSGNVVISFVVRPLFLSLSLLLSFFLFLSPFFLSFFLFQPLTFPLLSKAVQLSTGDIVYDHFEDSHSRSELETHLLQILPSELLIADSTSKQTTKVLKAVLGIGGTGASNQSNVRIETVAAAKFDHEKATSVGKTVFFRYISSLLSLFLLSSSSFSKKRNS